MNAQLTIPRPERARPYPFLAAIVIIVAVYACSIWANLSFAITNPTNFKYFPPFQAHNNANMNRHLGAEYLNIARSIRAGEGFASPFGQKTGPTAWMPPILAYLLAGLLWACAGDLDAVMTVFLFLQVNVLIATGLLVLTLAWQTTDRIGGWGATAIFLAGLLYGFRFNFQVTHDCWIVLLALDLVVAGLVWCRPLHGWVRAAAWGFVGGFCALISPIVGLAWGGTSMLLGWQQRAWVPLAVALCAGALTLMPWTIRNYLVMGRLMPVKSNLAYELYQSQCLQPDGLIQRSTFSTHPYGSAGPERQEYRALGEMAFLDKKRQLFWEAVGKDPLNFVERVADRFLGTTLWYVPFDRDLHAKRPWSFWLGRLIHPLPFLALLVLIGTGVWKPLHPAQWVVIWVYLLYLLPYIAASYYDRYGAPMLGLKVLLVIWAIDRLLSLWPARRVETEEEVLVLEAVDADEQADAVSAAR